MQVYLCLLFIYFDDDGGEEIKGKKAFTLRVNTLAALQFETKLNYRKCN